jgi:ectoine hydroxylase-related dioxygenase (phytanoyl-CoA dioxygenase family)
MKKTVNLPANYVQDYRDKGYAVIGGVFDNHEMTVLSDAFDDLNRFAQQYESTYRDKNQLFVYHWDDSSEKLLRFVKWPSYTFPVFEQFRTDLRILDILKPFLGTNIKQIANQASWKNPGDSRTSYSYHQDFYWRRPEEAFRDLDQSYIQVLIAVDPHFVENGCLSLVEESHKSLRCYCPKGSVLTSPFNVEDLSDYGLENHKRVNVLLEPGDVVIWGPYMFHGSDANRSSMDRRAYVNGYVSAEKCDRGEYAFLDGKAVPLAEPKLIDYEELFSRPEPHYI